MSSSRFTINSHRGREARKTPKAAIRPALRDLAWAAGFLEGEGTFHHTKNSQVVKAPQKQREPLEKLQAIFGGSIRLLRFGDNPNIFLWSVSGTRARGVMTTLFVFMSPARKEQIRAALQY
jgi:hypothetical protein